MSSYLITYDLVQEKKNPSHDYQVLWDELKRLGAFRTMYSVWLVATAMSPSQLRVHLQKYMDENDLVWVVKLFRNEYDYYARSGTTKWLGENPPESR